MLTADQLSVARDWFDTALSAHMRLVYGAINDNPRTQLLRVAVPVKEDQNIYLLFRSYSDRFFGWRCAK